ncbi:MAG: CHC2 zinc finger domain-containing protein [Limnoraphis sp.]
MITSIFDKANDVRDRLILSDVIESYGVSLKRSGSELKGLCPFHDESTPSFHVNDIKGKYHCFGCGAGGDVIRFVRDINGGIGFSEAVRMLSGESNLIRNSEVKREKVKSKSSPKCNPLPAEARHESHKKLILAFGLASWRSHHLIEDRGLTPDEVKWCQEQGFIFDWEPGAAITGVSRQLAGVDPNNGQLVGEVGMAIAAFNPDGQATGYQLKPDKPSKGKKYVWASSSWLGNSIHLPNGDQPLFVWKHPESKAIREVWLCEGALKSLLVALRLWAEGKYHIAVIGTATSANYPRETFKQYLAQLDPQIIRLFPDGGVGTNEGIRSANLKTINQVKNFGYKVEVAWWGQFDKSAGDIDELTNWGEIQYLSPDGFKIELGIDEVPSHQSNRHSSKLISKEQWESKKFLNWVKDNFNRAAYKFAKRFKKLPPNPVIKKVEIIGDDQACSLVKWEPPIQFVTDTLRWTPRVITSYEDWLYINDDWRETLLYLPGFLPCYEEWLKLGQPRVEFQGGDRNTLIAEAHYKGYWGVKDSSAPGQGKSHDSGELRLEDLGIDPEPKDQKGKPKKKPRLFRIDSSYRNPSTKTVEQHYSPLIARHGGLDYDHSRQTPMGNPYVIKHQKNSGKPYPDIEDECDLWDSFRALGEKGKFIPASPDNPFCMRCKKNEYCDFRKTRALILEEMNYISADINSMSNPSFQDVILIEESGVTLKFDKRFETNLNEIQSAIGKLFTRSNKENKNELMGVLIDVLDGVAIAIDEFNPENKRHGAGHLEIKNYFPKRKDLIAAIQEKYYDINFETESLGIPKDPSEYTRIFKDTGNGLTAHTLPTIKGIEAEVSRLLSENLAELAGSALSPEGKAKAIRDNLIYNIISPILRVIGGSKKHNLQIKLDPIKDKKLIITKPNYRQASIVKSAHFAIFLDATESVDKLQQKLNCNEHEQILEIAQVPPKYENLTIILIDGIGGCGKQRESGESDFAMKNRIEKALIAISKLHPEFNKALIDHKQFVGGWQHLIGKDKSYQKSGYWFRDTRGSNNFLDTQVIANVGMPVPNFGDDAATWQCMTGEIVNPTQTSGRYGAWKFNKVSAEIIQDIGRLRSHLRPHEQLYSYHLGNFTPEHIDAIKKAYPGAKVEVMDIYELCPEAAPKGVQMLRGIIRATAEAVRDGVAPKAQAIAQSLNTTKSNISQTLKRSLGITFRWLKICSQNLYRAINRKSEQIDLPDLTDEELWIAREYLPLLAQQLEQGVSESDEILEDLASVSESFGNKAMSRILQSVPSQTALTLYRLFISVLPEASRNDLRNFIDSSQSSMAIAT